MKLSYIIFNTNANRRQKMKKIMAAAHSIKKAAAKKWDCAESEIIFGICLKMAWKGEKIMGNVIAKCISTIDRVDMIIKDEVKKESGLTTKIWKNRRIYIGKGYIEVIGGEVNIGEVKRAQYMTVYWALKDAGIEFIG
jgi:hypothetical protein